MASQSGFLSHPENGVSSLGAALLNAAGLVLAQRGDRYSTRATHTGHAFNAISATECNSARVAPPAARTDMPSSTVMM